MKPILFNTDMIRAISLGLKTQTRRVIKPQPDENGVSFMANPPIDWEQVYNDVWKPWKYDTIEGETFSKFPPFGVPGTTLYIRETFCKIENDLVYKAALPSDYKLPESYKWTPSIHMHGKLSRIFLMVTKVRVERLQDISDKDAQLEGIKSNNTDGLYFYFYPCKDLRDDSYINNPKTSFYSLWKSIYGQEAWDFNPWVCVTEFELITRKDQS